MIIVILILIVVASVIVISLALLGAILLLSRQGWAKKQAKEMLQAKQITDMRKFDRVSSILAKTTNDLEAADLWKRLQELKQAQAPQT